MDHHEMMDMEWIDPVVRDEDQYKARDDISDGELIENDFYRSQDESTELEGIKKNHNKTQEKEEDRSKEKDFESETPKDYERDREKDYNPVKEKDKLKDRERHKSRDREKDKDRSRERDKEKEHEKDRSRERGKEKEHEKDRSRERDKEKEHEKDRSRECDKEKEYEKDRDGSRDGEEDKEKIRGKEREKDKDSISSKHRDKEKDKERGKERDKSKLKEKDREEDRRMERKKDQETGIRDTEKQKERVKDRNRDVENERDIETVKDRKEKERERDKEKDKEREKEKDRDKEGRERDRDKPRDKDRERERERDKDKEKEKDRDRQEREKDRDKVRDKERERDRDREREKEKERDKDEREKDRDKMRDKERERERDREREKEKEREKEERDKDRDKLRDKEKEREKEKEIDKDEKDKDRDKTRDREKERDRDKEREKEKERDKDDREKDRDKLKDKERDRDREKDREKDRDKERFRDRDRDKGREKVKERNRDRDRERESDRDKEREERIKPKDKENKDGAKSRKKEAKGYGDDIKEKEKKERDNEEKARKEPEGSHVSTTELAERLSKIREEKVKTKMEGGSEILSWVSKSRKIEEHKSAEREKAERLAKIFEEQDNVEDTESDDEEKTVHSGKDLAGLKVLHGLDKVMEGGAVVLTLKDQNVLAGDDVNDAVDMLENIEIGEQNARNEAYKAAKKKTGIYVDKFENDINTVKSILPQYDDPFKEEGVTIDQMGGINEEAHNKLDEIRKRLQGTAMTTQAEESLTQRGTIISDYYTQEEMLQFKKPKKKKKLRRKDKLDVDALEAEAIAAGLGAGDLGSRDDTERKVSRENAEKAEAELRKSAYQNAYKKAAEASRGLRDEKSSDAMQVDEDGDAVFGVEDEDLYKSLQKTRQAALRKQAESSGSGPQAVARLAVAANQAKGNGRSQSSSDVQENKVVFTEMEEFVWSLQLDEDTHKPVIEDVFKEDDEGPGPVKQDDVAETIGGWTEVKEMDIDTSDLNAEEDEEVVTDDIIKEASVGKGLAGALQLLKERGSLKESVEWGGRNMDKKKSKLVGVRDTDGPKEIQLDRLDEFGRIMTPKEAFRKLSHKFHGKGPGKMKQEKRMKQYQEELKLKQMNTGDTPLMSMEKMRDIQAKLHTPYIVLSGQIKPGQTSDPRSGFATVEKEVPGSLTPMLGDRKVEHFLGIKRKSEVGTMGPPKKPKT